MTTAPEVPTDGHVRAVANQVMADLGTQDGWIVPDLYRGSPALAVIDSIQSIGVRYANVENVVGRYRAHRGAAARPDGLSDLAQSFDDLSGVEGWIEKIGTRNLTSTTSGTLKAEVIRAAAVALLAAGVDDADSVRARLADDAEGVTGGASLEKLWNDLPGQSSGISFSYFTALLGMPAVKPDRMIVRYLSRAAGQTLRPKEAGVLLQSVAAQLDVTEVFVLDHNVWRFESGRTQQPPTDGLRS